SSPSLWLQLAIVVLSTVALAEPRLGSTRGVHRVLVLDAGLSSGARSSDAQVTVYEASWRRWMEGHRQSGGADTYSVWWAGPWTRPLALELTELAGVRTALEESTFADSPVDWGSLRGALQTADLEDAAISVFTTDLAKARNAFADIDTASLSFLPMPIASYNVGLIDVSFELLDGRAQLWSIAAVAMAGSTDATAPESATIRVTFLPEGASTPLPYAEREVRFNANGRARFTADLTFPGAGVVEVTVASGDSLPADDSVRFHLDPAPSLRRVLVVSAAERDSPTVRMLSAIDRFEIAVTADEVVPAGFDLVVVERAREPVDQETDATQKMLWLGSAPEAQVEGSDVTRTALAVRWDRDHPVSSGTDWEAISGANAVAIEGSGEVLVEGLDGPLVIARAGATGREIVAAYDPADPRFVESDAFVTFMVDALEWLAPRRRQVDACEAGRPCRVPWTFVQSGFEASLNGEVEWRQPPPAGTHLPSRLDEAWIPLRAGLWWLSAADGERHAVPVNP